TSPFNVVFPSGRFGPAGLAAPRADVPPPHKRLQRAVLVQTAPRERAAPAPEREDEEAQKRTGARHRPRGEERRTGLFDGNLAAVAIGCRHRYRSITGLRHEPIRLLDAARHMRG